ncbi:MAG: hypothetical protein COT45_01820 [bacterium (Candidatus Stahlbacteria) CG08_land_8_20_14_0_20_40_26]|nr:MAG: hypothetical protein COX49_01615 [bacterium (Candidatus Stahlbacteria) CG23_combo_of_CG06-09_8_20_14_all_40_9]PIS25825.1 MAG: hypothetical protein COT45_01820 [bacterium (Candidatus Stahlbacteria) CG08_land_8_20_14_0_20_40_26]
MRGLFHQDSITITYLRKSASKRSVGTVSNRANLPIGRQVLVQIKFPACDGTGVPTVLEIKKEVNRELKRTQKKKIYLKKTISFDLLSSLLKKEIGRRLTQIL